MEGNFFDDSDLDLEYTGTLAQLFKMTDTEIQDVYADNFETEMKKFMKLCEHFNVISMVFNIHNYRIHNFLEFVSIGSAASFQRKKMNMTILEGM